MKQPDEKPDEGHAIATSPSKRSSLSQQETLRDCTPNEDGEPCGTTGRKLRRTLIDIAKEQWLLFGLAVVIVIASQVQVAHSQQQVKTEVVAYLCVSIIFLITGCTLNTRALVENYARWKIHLFVQGQCFLMTSAVVFGFVEAIATNRHFLDPGLLVGLIFMSCMATTISSNVIMTAQAHGNQALTVVQTTIGNLIGVFVSPALVVMYTSVPTWYNGILPAATFQWGPIFARVMMRLGLSLYLPLFVGQVIRWFFPAACKKVFADWKLSKLSSLSLLVMLWQTFDTAFATKAFESVPGVNLVFLVFFSMGLILLFLAISVFTSLLWLPRKDVVAVAYCVPAKGIAVGVPVSNAIFQGLDLQLRAKILLPIVILQCLQLVSGAIMISVFRRWIDKHERMESLAKRDVETGAHVDDSPKVEARIESEAR